MNSTNNSWSSSGFIIKDNLFVKMLEINSLSCGFLVSNMRNNLVFNETPILFGQYRMIGIFSNSLFSQYSDKKLLQTPLSVLAIFNSSRVVVWNDLEITDFCL
jgi:hypothetical protein